MSKRTKTELEAVRVENVSKITGRVRTDRVGPKVSGTFLSFYEGDPMNKLGAEVTKSAMSRSVDRTILAGKSIVLFRAAIKSPQTLDPYERRLCNFLNHVGMSCDEFVVLAKKNPAKAEGLLIEYAVKDKDRLHEGDAAAFQELQASLVPELRYGQSL